MKKKFFSGMIFIMLCFLSGCGGSAKTGETLTVFNYGQYIDESVISQFEDETGITVVYEETLSPEDLYSKYQSGVIDYDVMCTTDYMIDKLRQEGELLPIDYDTMEQIVNIGERYWKFTEAFDPDRQYSVPYFWGTIGILYDTTKVKEPVESWSIVFDGEYAGDLIMPNSMRDPYMVALKYLGYSINTSNEDEIAEAQKLLVAQKPDVQAYLVDEARDELVAGNAAMAVMYSGDAFLATQYNEDLAYTIPKEGSNVWMDSWVIPKTCKNKEAAQKWLDFLCREDIAQKNFDEIFYSTPNTKVEEAMDEEMKALVMPTDEQLAGCEVCSMIDDHILSIYSDDWKKLKSD